MDGWSDNSVNRIRYSATRSNTNAFTTSGGMRNTGMAALTPDLHVCASGTGVTATACSGTVTTLASTAVAVIFSAGKNAPSGGTGTDESKNYDGDQVFVSHDLTAGVNEFDDSVIWISPNLLYSRMVAAGQLP